MFFGGLRRLRALLPNNFFPFLLPQRLLSASVEKIQWCKKGGEAREQAEGERAIGPFAVARDTCLPGYSADCPVDSAGGKTRRSVWTRDQRRAQKETGPEVPAPSTGKIWLAKRIHGRHPAGPETDPEGVVTGSCLD